MHVTNLLQHLRLPAATVRQWRVAKTDFAAQLKTPADRRAVIERVESLVWHAALNPELTALPAGGMPGLAVVVLTTKAPQPPPRLPLLVHRAVPDPLLLVVAYGDAATSLSVKPALGEAISCPVSDVLAPEAVALLSTDRATSLADLHARWCQAVLGLCLAESTGRFPPPLPADRDATGWQQRREALDRLVALDRQIEKMTQSARQERQLARRAELNEQLQAARRERQAIAATL